MMWWQKKPTLREALQQQRRADGALMRFEHAKRAGIGLHESARRVLIVVLARSLRHDPKLVHDVANQISRHADAIERKDIL